MSNSVGGVSWESKVYHPAEGMSKVDSAEWKAVAKVIKKRDKYACQSCGSKLGLTVHHILPRSDGGNDLPDNLITLCSYCHDEVESLELKDKWQIVDMKRNRKYIKQDKKIVSDEKAEDWHQWVYGGYKRP